MQARWWHNADPVVRREGCDSVVSGDTLETGEPRSGIFSAGVGELVNAVFKGASGGEFRSCRRQVRIHHERPHLRRRVVPTYRAQSATRGLEIFVDYGSSVTNARACKAVRIMRVSVLRSVGGRRNVGTEV